jgi:hypothetical protein
MSMPLIISEEAEADLAEAKDWYARQREASMTNSSCASKTL